MKRDECLVRHFLDGYGRLINDSFDIRELPDQTLRECQAVEAIATNRSGIRFAFEHTLLQPFEGQKQDDTPFLKVFLPLERDSSLILPGFNITVIPPVEAVPKGVNWSTVGRVVQTWFSQNSQSFPIGPSEQLIGGLPFSLQVQVRKTPFPGRLGKNSIARKWPDKPFENIMRKALNDKLAKLRDAKADKRILIFEQNVPYGEIVISDAIESLSEEYPDISKIDSIWAVDTVSWESDGAIFFYQISPNLGEWFEISPASLP
jgi:hypothetical protein